MSNEVLDRDVRMWAMICHLSALASFTCIPFAGLIAPLVIWLLKREQHPFLDQQGREAVNFQISMAIYGIVSAILIFVVIGFLMLLALIIMDLVLVITAAIRANDGINYRYPLTIRFL
jgi:uncharacterized protein